VVERAGDAERALVRHRDTDDLAAAGDDARGR
jgi:hypothetical protein